MDEPFIADELVLKTERSVAVSITKSGRKSTNLFGLVLVAAGFGLLANRAAAQTDAPSHAPKQAVVTVKGMQCPFCAYGIKKHLAKLPEVEQVEVELAENRAIVTFAPDAKTTDEQIQRAVRKAGFTAGKIEWRSPPKESTTEL